MEIQTATQVTDELCEAFARLIPQLSTSAKVPDRTQIAEIVENETLFLAQDPTGRIVGMLTLVMFRIPTGIRAWIEDVVVDNAARGQGAGEALTRAALNHARAHGAKTVDLSSRPSREAANRLYQRVGFTRRETNMYRYNLE
jgi:ribosomal protein S18 acetylase RimI-like enzyme